MLLLLVIEVRDSFLIPFFNLFNGLVFSFPVDVVVVLVVGGGSVVTLFVVPPLELVEKSLIPFLETLGKTCKLVWFNNKFGEFKAELENVDFEC